MTLILPPNYYMGRGEKVYAYIGMIDVDPMSRQQDLDDLGVTIIRSKGQCTVITILQGTTTTTTTTTTTRRIGCMVGERWIGDGVGERKEEGGTCKGERGYI